MVGPRCLLALAFLAGYRGNVAPAKHCADNKTCVTELPAAVTTTAKNPSKTASDGRIVRYDVIVNDTVVGAAPKETVVIEAMPSDFVTDPHKIDDNKKRNSSSGPGNTTSAGDANTNVVKPNTGVNNVTTSITNAPTDNPNANANTTATTTTSNTSITTTTTTTTTTYTTTEMIKKSRPPINKADVVRFISDKYCYCDLIYGRCDINCCCDSDCTNHDLKTFTLCSDQAAKSGLIKTESILFDSSLFYVVIDNVPSDYFYPERDPIESDSQVSASLRYRDVYAWQEEKTSRPRMDSVHNTYDLTYKSLRWMYTVVSHDANSSEIKTFSLKNSAFSSLCTVEDPVEYLLAKETNCQTFVPNLTVVCNNDSSLSFKRYYGERGLFKVVQPISSGVHKTEKIGLVTIHATKHHHCVSTNGSSYDCHVRKAGRVDDPHPQYHPVYSGGVCRRIVDVVEYRLTHNGTRGVRKVDVHFYHRDVLDAGRPVYLDQRFEVRFDWAAGASTVARVEVESYERSGKPGYMTGSPVLVTDGGKETAAKRRHPKTMDLPESDANGACQVNLTGRRRHVNFLENVDVRCRVRVQRRWTSKRTEESTAAVAALNDLCHDIQVETISALGDYERTLVSSLGDPDVAKWIPTVVVKPPPPPSSSQPSTDDASSCPGVTDRVRIRVLHSHAGSFDDPQATILGVLVNYTATTVTVNNVAGPSDDSEYFNHVVADIPIAVSVVFIDLTRPPVRTFAEPPTYEFRLPEDFYYPFWSSGDPASGTGSSTIGGPANGTGSLSKFEFMFMLLVTSYFSYRNNDC